jgi:hypothetical protein
MEQAEAVAPHGVDRMAGGPTPHGRVLRRRVIKLLRAPAFVTHRRDQPPVISDLGAGRWRLGRPGRTVRVSQSLLLCREMVAAPQNYSMTRE